MILTKLFIQSCTSQFLEQVITKTKVVITNTKVVITKTEVVIKKLQKVVRTSECRSFALSLVYSVQVFEPIAVIDFNHEELHFNFSWLYEYV